MTRTEGDILGLSSGTLATLTGVTDREELDKIQNDLFLFAQGKDYRNWQDAWTAYRDAEDKIQRKQYKVGQRIRIELQNNYHSTRAIAFATVVAVTPEIVAEIDYTAAQRAAKKLCGMPACRCGEFRGRHQVQATGERVHIEEPANRCGSNVDGERPENPMRLIIKK